MTFTNYWPEYPLKLDDVPIGQPFMMLNYRGIYVRVSSGNGIQCFQRNGFNQSGFPFNDDGFHVPIVRIVESGDQDNQFEWGTGILFYMSKEKPCRLWHGIIRF